ncbi:MAG TPA: T9SS type A sorting domain-containing protein [Chitinophagales bacterium]|nr:T9SS type A sorting domain-containing protein [Chitinophagales bacterium]
MKKITNEMQITLYDMYGKQIADEKGINNYITFNLKSFTSGTYFIIVRRGLESNIICFSKNMKPRNENF